MNRRGHWIASGRVQGVCYRMAAEEEARRLGLRGWIRNCPDGTVEIVAEGDEASLRAFRDWCRHGPDFARVSGFAGSESPASGEFTSFTIRR
jgi:acylphosphatase